MVKNVPRDQLDGWVSDFREQHNLTDEWEPTIVPGTQPGSVGVDLLVPFEEAHRRRMNPYRASEIPAGDQYMMEALPPRKTQ